VIVLRTFSKITGSRAFGRFHLAPALGNASRNSADLAEHDGGSAAIASFTTMRS
jgi:hypothetical protein